MDQSTNDFENHQAFFVCERLGRSGWGPYHDVRLPVDDLGFRQAVTAVERLRTYGGVPFRMPQHWQRLQRTLGCLRIKEPAGDDWFGPVKLTERVQELLSRNASLVQSCGDVGITVWVTPGERADAAPSMAMHLNPIDHELVAQRRREGQAVVLTTVTQPDPSCWPRQAKVRCRLHYYLADQMARDIAKQHSVGSVPTGLLRDSDGTWTESGIANVGLIVDGEIVLAPEDRVLPGVTQDFVISVAKTRGIHVRRLPMTTRMIRDAENVLLMGTDNGVWFGSEVLHADRSESEPLCKFDSPESDGVVRILQAELSAATEPA
ncbi:aminotransferase class IV [Rhodopirellula sallentina]|uniref:Aminotransferase class IV n=1 Tax=Rhodopirellula sallentina SM41 TaxID=1263870 RepID=M5UMN9_9BACT|nr:aminotransferase class IV [Rhodopirellula sallentina]EMI57263.1 aminotransferase class IV [Rhodopirellula sallentina SM41]